MNELLQKHGCANVFTVPEGLKELMSDITREVLRDQPPNIFEYIANYLSALIVTREHGIMAVKILDDLCDCRPSVSEHLLQVGVDQDQAQALAEIIKEEVEGFEPEEGKERIKEYLIIKRILKRAQLDEVMAAKVCQVARNAYRDYWYKKKTMEKALKLSHEEPWEIAAQRTLEIYKRTKPSFNELTRAAEKIQAAYKGYHVRRNLLRHLKPKPKKRGTKVELLGPPLDVAGSRQIDFGPLTNIRIREDNVHAMFDEHVSQKLGLPYDPMTTLTHVRDDDEDEEQYDSSRDRPSRVSAASAVSAKFGPSLLPMPTMSQLESRQSRLPSAVASQVSKVVSQLPLVTPRQSRLPSQAPTPMNASAHRISFSSVPAQIIPSNVAEAKSDVGEPEPQEVIELLKPEAVEAAETDQEIPEDITGEHTEDEGESAPTASIPSSAPDTAPTTDGEDEGQVDDLNTTGEEEGE